MKIKEFVGKITLYAIIFVCLCVNWLIPTPLYLWLTHRKVKCHRCNRTILQERNFEKKYPFAKGKPPCCDECHTPEEREEIEELVDKAMKEKR